MDGLLLNLLSYRPTATGLSRYTERLLFHWAESKRNALPVQLKLSTSGSVELTDSIDLPSRQESNLVKWLQSNAIVQHGISYSHLINNKKFNIIYSPYTDFLFSLSDLPQVITCHDLIPLFYPNSRRAYLRSRYWLPFHLKRATKVIAISRSVADLLVQNGISARKIEIIHNGIQLDLNPIKSPLTSDILVIGRHSKNKNLQATLKGFSKFLQDHSFWDGNLVIVGSPDRMTAALHKLAIDLGVSSRIQWLSSLGPDELDVQIRKSFCLISSSLMEGFDYPLMEAQARGIPTIASNIPVHRELHLNKSLFFSFDESGVSLANQLGRLTKDLSLWLEISQGGLDHVKCFTLGKQLTAIQKVLKEVVI